MCTHRLLVSALLLLELRKIWFIIVVHGLVCSCINICFYYQLKSGQALDLNASPSFAVICKTLLNFI